MISRRELLIAFGLGMVSAPTLSIAQPARVWRIGVLAPRSRPVIAEDPLYGAFVRSMRDLGYLEGKNLVIEWRFADGKYERLPAQAEELARLSVDVMLAATPPAVHAAKQATSTIPIVMLTISNAEVLGFVPSLARPGGNITGMSNLAADVVVKHPELLRAAIPRLAHIGVLVNPGNQVHKNALKLVHESAKTLGARVSPVVARKTSDIEDAFGGLAKKRAAALIVLPDPLFFTQARQIAGLAMRNRMPTIVWARQLVDAGCLLSYGPDLAEDYRRAATYVDRILKGAKPGELPVEQPTKLELVINRRTAKALGLTIPQELLLRADEVIE